MNKTLLSLAFGAAFAWLTLPALAQNTALVLQPSAAPAPAPAPAPAGAASAREAHERAKSLGVVTVTGGRPISVPTQIPITMEGVTREEIETRINPTEPDRQAVFDGLRHRQRQQRPVLELSSVGTAHLHGRTSLRPVTQTLKGILQ